MNSTNPPSVSKTLPYFYTQNIGVVAFLSLPQYNTIMTASLTDERISKGMSFVLRHKPETVGITLSETGWVSLEVLASALSTHFREPITVSRLHAIVKADAKQRYTVKDGQIRAAQGHSVSVSLELSPSIPPAVLYHGTVEAVVPSILVEGLVPGKRQHVHLSATVDTATSVGARRGSPVVLTVRALDAFHVGVEFFQAENGVWLTAHVPAEFIIR